jgi:hypothetical protein
MGFSPMVLHHALASGYLAATAWLYSTHQPVCVYRSWMYGLDGPAEHLQLAGIFNQPGPTTNLVCCEFSLLALNTMGTLQMALDLTR